MLRIKLSFSCSCFLIVYGVLNSFTQALNQSAVFSFVFAMISNTMPTASVKPTCGMREGFTWRVSVESIVELRLKKNASRKEALIGSWSGCYAVTWSTCKTHRQSGGGGKVTYEVGKPSCHLSDEDSRI